MFFDLNVSEKLYWLSRNDGEREVGYLLNKEQLLSVLPPVYMSKNLENGEPSYRMRDYSYRVPNGRDLEKLLYNEGNCFTGSYKTGDLFTVTEITKRSQIKDFLTWAKYDPECALNTHKIEEPYPDYVSPKYRLSRGGETMDCVTSSYLPDKHEKNPTVEKYRKMFGIPHYAMRFRYTKEQQAAVEIAEALEGGYLSPELYKEIVLASVLSQNDMTRLQEAEADYSRQEAPEVPLGVIRNPPQAVPLMTNITGLNISIYVPEEAVEDYSVGILDAIQDFEATLATAFPGTQLVTEYNETLDRMETERGDYD